MASIAADAVDDTTNALESNEAEIFTYSPNPESSGPTIIFIHGLGSSHLEFTQVHPHLQDDYHILLVDLPGHSRSRDVPRPYSYQAASAHVQRVIQRQAHGRQAHVVGLSLGGFVGLQLTAEAPDCVLSLFATGATPFGGFRRALARRPRVLYVMSCATNWLVPAWLYNKLCDWLGIKRHPELRREMEKNGQYSLISDGFTSLLDFGKERFVEVGKKDKRVLIVAGGKGDDVKGTKSMGMVLRESGSPLSKATVVRKAYHAWDLQFPELFAAGIRAWIEEKELPAQFEVLDSTEM
jgi:pimeloyl-ACP methyl ester carboxylesterase